MSKGFRLRSPDTIQKFVHEIEFPEYPSGSSVLIIDADILSFKVASVCEYKFRFTHKETGEEVLAKSIKAFKESLEQDFEYWAEKVEKLKAKKKPFKGAQKKLESIGVFDDYEREDVQIPDPFEYCAKTLKDSIARLKEQLEVDHVELYLGGSDNFRLDLPLPLQYKSHRQGQQRPIHLSAAKEYLQKRFGAIRIKGREADDVVQQRLFELSNQGVRAILYSNDKDARQGWYGEYYNPDDQSLISLDSRLGEIKDNGKGTGLKFLLWQLTHGDDVDCYSPKQWFSKTYGPKSFYKDFNDVKSEKEALEKFISLMRDKLLDKEVYEWDDWKGQKQSMNWLGIVELMFSCAYMKLSVDDDTTFTKLCEEFGVDVNG